MIPPGLIVVPCGDNGRWTNFSASIASQVIELDDESAIMWSVGSSVADNLNDGVRAVLANASCDWLWIMGDDHEWDRDLLPRMLQRVYEQDLDALVPLCMKRGWPPSFVLYDHWKEPGIVGVMSAESVARAFSKGEHTIEVLAAGTAGMLVRRRVLAQIERPWFRNVLTGPDGVVISQGGEDLNFCGAIINAGFKIHAALDLPLGHIAGVTLAPELSRGALGVRLFFGGRDGPFIRLADVQPG